jgi:hypothetical protein
MDMRRSIYAFTALWFAVCVTYFLHPQVAIPLWPELAVLGKGQVLVMNCVLCAAAVFYHQRSAALLALAAGSAVSVAAMHSWIGAHLQVLPWAFLFLALLRAQSASEIRATTLAIFILGLAAAVLYSTNPLYLTGAEFDLGGTMYRLLPGIFAREVWLAHRQLLAVLWLALGALTVITLVLLPRVGWGFFLLYAFFSVFLFRVLFFGFFVLVPLAYLWDPELMLHWRRAKALRFKPVHLYGLGMALFFIWYVYFFSSVIFFLLATAVSLASVALSRWPSSMPQWRWSLPRGVRAICLSLWLAYLLLPALSSAIPTPFGMTQLTARQLLYPFREEMEWPADYCLWSKLALRWGYRMVGGSDTCVIAVYRAP